MPHPALAHISHRPWPLPREPWSMRMSWHDLLFAHWPVPFEALRAHVPRPLEIDTFDGVAWLGVVPFTMTGVRPRFAPGLPGASTFHELNVRTYVRMPGADEDEQRPGVWFFSLDAASRLAVRLARTGFFLPYFDARIELDHGGDDVRYVSERTHRGSAPAAFEARYGPRGDVTPAAEGTLEHWLTERYCLYAGPGLGSVWRADVHHGPWPLQPAEATIHTDTLTAHIGIDRPGRPELLHFARRLDVVGWRPRRVAGAGA